MDTVERRQKRVYIAGPMTGIENYNFGEFDRAEKGLRECGMNVVNPATLSRRVLNGRLELEPEELSKLIEDELEMLVDCDAILLLRGWENSLGAKKELYHAIGNGLEVWVQKCLPCQTSNNEGERK